MKKQNILRAIFTVLAVTILINAGSALAATKKTTKKATSAKAAAPTLKIDNNTVGMTAAEIKVYKKIKAQRQQMPEGMPWSNADSYQFKGGIFGTGYGCSGFAFKMSDIAFGKKKATMHKNFNKIKVGDIIRLDDNTHSVIVMKVVGSSLVVAEGNYNASVHWGRIIKKSEVKKTGTYVMTRY